MTLKTLVLAATLLVGTAASAATVLSAPASTGALASPGSFSTSFSAPAGAATTSFVLQGFLSLDGVNPYQDTFTLNLNGTDIFSGSFDLGGGGSDVVFISGGETLVKSSVVFFGGGELSVTLPTALAAGTNTLTFSYAGDAQGLGDEAWGVRALTVTTAAAVVPEPASWALLVGGFALVGFAARRRSAVVAA